MSIAVCPGRVVGEMAFERKQPEKQVFVQKALQRGRPVQPGPCPVPAIMDPADAVGPNELSADKIRAAPDPGFNIIPCGGAPTAIVQRRGDILRQCSRADTVALSFDII